MRLKLRDDVVFATTTDGGVYVLGPYAEAVFTGASVRLWLDRLTPLLDGRHTLAELTRGLSADRGALVEHMIQALRDNDLLVEEPGDRVAAVMGDESPLLAAVVRAARLSRFRVVRAGAGAPDGVDLVFHVGTPAQAERVAQRCASRGITCAQAVSHGAHVWLSVACDGAGWRRLDRTPTKPSTVDRTAAAVIAGQLVHHAIRRMPPGRMICVEPATLASGRHDYLPHPFGRPASAQSRAEFLATIAAYVSAAPLGPEDFSRRAATIVDSRLGVLRGLGEYGHPQTPLHIAEARVSDPAGLGGGPSAVLGCGLDVATARHRAALAGIAAYCSRMVDPRRFLVAELLWGYRLHDGQSQQVPVAQVFPPRRGARGLSRGVGCGYGWAEAMTAGLMAHCRRLTVAEMTGTPDRYPRIDLDTIALDDTGVRYLALLTALGDRVVVHDITGPLGVPTVAVRRGRRTVAYASANDLAGALRSGLERVLLWHQGVGPVPSLAAGAPDAAVTALAAAGHRAVAVPLDHDPELSRILPPAVRVLLVDG